MKAEGWLMTYNLQLSMHAGAATSQRAVSTAETTGVRKITAKIQVYCVHLTGSTSAECAVDVYRRLTLKTALMFDPIFSPV